MRFAFEIEKATATLEHLNLRVEKEGGEKFPAADLKVIAARGAEVLAYFSPTLKAFLFDENGPRDLADGLPLRDAHMVFPLARDEEMVGATVSIEFGVGAPMVFAAATVNQFKITPKEGGTVIVGFRVQCRPTPEQVGRLYEMQEQGITISITPPELAEMAEAAA